MKQALAILGIGFYLASIASHIENWRLDKEDAAYRIHNTQRLSMKYP
jgi:hypothetical protein